MKFQRPRTRAVVFGAGLVAATVLPGAAPVAAATNLVPNPKLETLVKGFPKCWTAWGSGSAKGKAKVVRGRSGKRAVRVSLTGGKGQRALVQTPACAIKATPGRSFDLSVFYKSTAPVRFVLFRQNAKGVWSHWTDSAGL